MKEHKKECLICGNETFISMQGLIMGKYLTDYHSCEKCECIFINNPFWLKEAYSESIVRMDTGIMVRNYNVVNALMIIFKAYFKSDVKVVDFGGGYGILTRMLRDKGVDAYWDDKYSQNLVCRGFEYNGTSAVDVVLAFEVMEHLENPIKTLKEILSKTNCFIFSTDLLPQLNYTSNDEWDYFAPEAGQHIFFYSEKTLKTIAHKFGLEYSKINKLHIFHEKGLFKRRKLIVKLKFLIIRIFIQVLDFFVFGNKYKSRFMEDHRNIRIKMKNN
jgi:hypothetical protein